MRTNRTQGTTGVIVLLLVSVFAGLLVVPIVQAAGCNASANGNGDASCGWHCEGGDVFKVSGNANGEVWGHADCGFESAACNGTKECVPTEAGTADSATDGSCYGNGAKAYIQCATTENTADFIDVGGVLQAILDHIRAGSCCSQIEPLAIQAGVKSLIVKAIDGFGPGTTVFVYNARVGCGGVPTLPATNEPAATDQATGCSVFTAGDCLVSAPLTQPPALVIGRLDCLGLDAPVTCLF
jgi:hypothetical protein